MQYCQQYQEAPHKMTRNFFIAFNAIIIENIATIAIIQLVIRITMFIILHTMLIILVIIMANIIRWH